MRKTILIALVAAVMIVPFFTFAKIGVGVGTGKIQVDQPMKPGLIYTLPSLVIINTGDEASEYGVGIQYKEKQSELKPEKEWFSFEPSSFYLESGQSQVVQIKLTLPITGARPGDYFAFLQGFPAKKVATAGMTSVGVAAAAKLYFTIAPANFLAGLYWRAASLAKLYSPWSYVVLAVILATILVVILLRFISFNIGINIRKKQNELNQ